jgi:parallel beta-helix repeat protein
VKLFLCDVVSSSGSGIGVEAGNVTVFSCTIHDCKNHGVLYVGSGATGRVERCIVEKCKLNGLLLRDGASPTLSDNLLKGNGQYGAALIDCRGVLLDNNEVVRNGKGAVNGECDEVGE